MEWNELQQSFLRQSDLLWSLFGSLEWFDGIGEFVCLFVVHAVDV